MPTATTTATAGVPSPTNGSSQSHDKQYCVSCKREIAVKGYENHCKTQRHRERAKDKKRSRPWLAANPDKTYDDCKIGTFWCDICEKNVRLNHKEAHRRTQSHTNKLLNSPIIPAEKFGNVYKSYAVRINHPSNVDAQFAYAKPYITDLHKVPSGP